MSSKLRCFTDQQKQRTEQRVLSKMIIKNKRRKFNVSSENEIHNAIRLRLAKCQKSEKPNISSFK